MIIVHPTSNVTYLRKCAESMARHVGLTPENRENAERVMADARNRFYAVHDDTDYKGFVSYHYIADGIYSIHTCLRTLGSRTECAIRNTLDRMKATGAKLIIAVFAAKHRALSRLADALGFVQDESISSVYTLRADHPMLHFKLAL